MKPIRPDNYAGSELDPTPELLDALVIIATYRCNVIIANRALISDANGYDYINLEQVVRSITGFDQGDQSRILSGRIMQGMSEAFRASGWDVDHGEWSYPSLGIMSTPGKFWGLRLLRPKPSSAKD